MTVRRKLEWFVPMKWGFVLFGLVLGVNWWNLPGFRHRAIYLGIFGAFWGGFWPLTIGFIPRRVQYEGDPAFRFLWTMRKSKEEIPL